MITDHVTHTSIPNHLIIGRPLEDCYFPNLMSRKTGNAYTVVCCGVCCLPGFRDFYGYYIVSLLSILLPHSSSGLKNLM